MPTKHKPGKALCATLKEMLEEAEKKQGNNIQYRCTNNLLINMRMMGGIVVLKISRSTRYPSKTDWRTVMRHMPFELNIPYEQVAREGRCWLRGCWVLQKEMDLHSDRSDRQPANAN